MIKSVLSVGAPNTQGEQIPRAEQTSADRKTQNVVSAAFARFKQLITDLTTRNSPKPISAEQKRMQEYRQLMLVQVIHNGLNLQYADPLLRGDREVVLKAVGQNGMALEYADPQMKDDLEIVLAAVGNNCDAVERASERLQKHPEVVSVARKAAKELEPETISLLMAIEIKGILALQHASAKLRNDKGSMLKLVSKIGLALEYASEKLQKNKDVVLEAVRQNGLALKFADPDVREDREVALAAVTEDPHALAFVGSHLQGDIQFLCEGYRAVALSKKDCFLKTVDFYNKVPPPVPPLSTQILQRVEQPSEMDAAMIFGCAPGPSRRRNHGIPQILASLLGHLGGEDHRLGLKIVDDPSDSTGNMGVAIPIPE